MERKRCRGTHHIQHKNKYILTEFEYYFPIIENNVLYVRAFECDMLVEASQLTQIVVYRFAYVEGKI